MSAEHQNDYASQLQWGKVENLKAKPYFEDNVIVMEPEKFFTLF